jgi:hypothetical protein
VVVPALVSTVQLCAILLPVVPPQPVIAPAPTAITQSISKKRNPRRLLKGSSSRHTPASASPAVRTLDPPPVVTHVDVVVFEPIVTAALAEAVTPAPDAVSTTLPGLIVQVGSTAAVPPPASATEQVSPTVPEKPFAVAAVIVTILPLAAPSLSVNDPGDDASEKLPAEPPLPEPDPAPLAAAVTSRFASTDPNPVDSSKPAPTS